MLKKRVISFVPADVQRDKLMTIAEAARILGATTQTVTIRVQKGLMTMYVDEAAPVHQGRTLLLRSEVEQWKRSREQG